MLKFILLGAAVLLLVCVGALLLWGRSKVQSDGTLFIVGEAPLMAPADRSFDRVLSVDGLKAWWLGTLETVAASPRWPEPGETLSFKMGDSQVTYRATELERPRKLVAVADYPDATSTITQEFLGATEGGPVYRKTLRIKPKPGVGALKTWMLGAVVAFSVPKECQRAAEYAAK